MTAITISSNIRNYQVNFLSDASVISDLSQMPNSIFIIDRTVWDLHHLSTLSGITPDSAILLDINEDRKNLATVQDLYDSVIKFSPKRNMTIISIGGGITQDITGFVASSLYRGVNWIYIPTTLLAQADSCIGAKTSLNYKQYKNLIGTFYPPAQIFIYPGFLKTLKKIDYFSGLGEIGKLYINGGISYIRQFEKKVNAIKDNDEEVLLAAIKDALLIKKEYIEDDEFDAGKRNMLNFGHCFGHAIETATEYAIPHGQAVVLGIILANIISRSRKLLNSANEQYLFEKILQPTMYVNPLEYNFDVTTIIKGMEQDKKRVGDKLPLIMVNDDFQMVKITDLDKTEVHMAFQELNKIF